MSLPHPDHAAAPPAWPSLRAILADGDGRRLTLIAAAFATVALVHLGVFALDDSAWAGPVSWRKPFAFGASFALLSATLAFANVALPKPPNARRWTWIFAGASGVEWALIALQAWRRVPSHFNVATPFDTAVWIAMGLFVIFAAIPIVGWAGHAIRTARDPSRAADAGLIDLALALGLALTVLGLGGGIWLVVHGPLTLAPAATPSTLAIHRAVVVAHAIGLHAAQVLPLLGVLAAVGAEGDAAALARARRALFRAGSGVTLVIVAVFAHGASGHALTEPGAGWLFVALGAALFATPSGAIAALALARVGARPAPTSKVVEGRTRLERDSPTSEAVSS